MKYHELYHIGNEKLKTVGIEEAELDARLILEAVCGTSRHDLLVNGEKAVAAEQAKSYVNYIAKRENRIPLQYILGEQEFMGLKFIVTPDTLIPRQDTETLVEEIMRHMHDGQSILDMGTGTGCILLSLLHYSNHCTGTGADISAAALAVARKNEKEIAALPRQGERMKPVTWIQSDLFAEVRGRFDIIVANPPYIPTADIAALMPEIRDCEPILALDGKSDGLYFYRKIIDRSGQFLCPGGMLFLEIGHDQAAAVTAKLAEYDYYDINIVKDLAGQDRVIYATHHF